MVRRGRSPRPAPRPHPPMLLLLLPQRTHKRRVGSLARSRLLCSGCCRKRRGNHQGVFLSFFSLLVFMQGGGGACKNSPVGSGVDYMGILSCSDSQTNESSSSSSSCGLKECFYFLCSGRPLHCAAGLWCPGSVCVILLPVFLFELKA